MLDSRFVRNNPDIVKENLRRRHAEGADVEGFLLLEQRRLSLLKSSEEKKQERNLAAKKIGQEKQQSKQPSENKGDGFLEETAARASLKTLSQEIKQLDGQLAELNLKQDAFLQSLPNLIDESSPEGDERANVLLRQHGKLEEKTFPIKAHFELGQTQLDFKRAAKLSGARFSILKGELAMLERALANFFLEQNIQNGFTEVSPPSLVNEQSMYRSGQLPKFADDVFRLAGDFSYLYLISTAEISLVNLHADEILDRDLLPLRYTAYTNCYRSEAGAAGRDTRGLMRLHEFKKVELVSICLPEESEAEHQSMVLLAEKLLQALKLPYRVMLLASGDTGFSAKRCYDLEVWIPSEKRYREVSSCSNCGDFQCRRAKIRYRQSNGRAAYPHALNASALPLGRILIAVLENFQQADASVAVPEVLWSFMKGRKFIFKS